MAILEDGSVVLSGNGGALVEIYPEDLCSFSSHNLLPGVKVFIMSG